MMGRVQLLISHIIWYLTLVCNLIGFYPTTIDPCKLVVDVDSENMFQLKEGAMEVTVALPTGNYNRKSLATVVTTALNSASSNYWTYSVIFPNSHTE
jgi:hypothetical protein